MYIYTYIYIYIHTYIHTCIYICIGGREARPVGESGLGAAGAHLLYWYKSTCLLVQKYRY